MQPTEHHPYRAPIDCSSRAGFETLCTDRQRSNPDRIESHRSRNRDADLTQQLRQQRQRRRVRRSPDTNDDVPAPEHCIHRQSNEIDAPIEPPNTQCMFRSLCGGLEVSDPSVNERK